MADSDFLSSSEQLHRPDIYFLKVNDTHAKDFLAYVMGFFIYTRDVDDFIWCEVRKNGCCRPNTQVAENGLPSL